MAKPTQSAARVSQTLLRRLYRSFRTGAHDDELLHEIGWTLYSRCQEVLMVTRAARGEVPCPQCGHLVVRPKHAGRIAARRHQARLVCPGCSTRVTWEACRQALLDRPRCLVCHGQLQTRYSDNALRCPHCAAVWPWRKYRTSVNRRRLLPCPHCEHALHRPSEIVTAPVPPPPAGDRPERLCCQACGHTFTWSAWRRRHGLIASRTGNLAPVERYLERWPRSRRPGEQSIEIDTLVHAMHIRGSMAHLFLEGDEASLRALLDELAQSP